MQDTLRLDVVELKNVRAFAALQMELHRDLTILVADNGGGKSTLLDALASGLEPIIKAFWEKSVRPLGGELVRAEVDESGRQSHALPASLSLAGLIDGERCRWFRERRSMSSNARAKGDVDPATKIARGLMERLTTFAGGDRDMAPQLPLVAYYGTGRLWDQARLTRERRSVSDDPMKRTSGYLDALAPSSSFKTFVSWYEQLALEARSSTGRFARLPARPEQLLAAVQKAAETVLAPSGWSRLDWDFDEEVLMVAHTSGRRLPVSFLSDGVRTMLALVADVAHRCARLNPQFGEQAAERTPGIILIDEVDMHLHPSWQQQCVRLLQRAFPHLQLVLTTHSPQVLSTVAAESIRILSVGEDGIGAVTEPREQTRGVEAGDVLEGVMGVDEAPDVEELRLVREYERLIQDGRWQTPEGQRLRDSLVDFYGRSHRTMRRLDRAIRMQSFKLNKQERPS